MAGISPLAMALPLISPMVVGRAPSAVCPHCCRSSLAQVWLLIGKVDSAQFGEELATIKGARQHAPWAVAESTYGVWEELKPVGTHDDRDMAHYRVGRKPAEQRPAQSCDLGTMDHNHPWHASESCRQIVGPAFDRHGIAMVGQQAAQRVHERGGAPNKEYGCSLHAPSPFTRW
jgi:hypothetical protein